MTHVKIINNVYILFFVYVLKVTVLGQWVVDDDGCRTPDRGVGNCIPIKLCKPMVDFLQTAPKPLSQKVIDGLNAYTCSFEANTVKVCCPSSPIIIEDSTDSGVTSTEYPLPPDITRHRNYNLLPKNCGYLPLGDKISYGKDADLNEFPWMALLSYNTRNGPQFRCGGSIINEKWILTAAHCVTELKEPLLGVRTGEHNIQTRIDCEIQQDGSNKCTSPVQDVAIEEIRVHPLFNLSVISNDIALLKVTRMNLNVENVRPVCLPIDQARDAKFKTAVVTGWGFTETGHTSNVLQKVNLPIVSLEQCQITYKNQSRAHITYKNICAGGKDKKDSCPGDSGGPMQVAAFVNNETRYVQQGIVSFGPRICGLDGFPGVYTRIAYYMDWILDTIGS